MFGPGKLIELKIIIDETLYEFEFIRNSHEGKFCDLEFIKNWISDISKAYEVSDEAEKGIYSEKLMKIDFKNDIESILRIYIECNKDHNDLNLYCNKFKKSEMNYKELSQTVRNSVGSREFNCLINRKFCVKSLSAKVNSDFKAYEIFKSKKILSVSLPSLLLLEEEFLYRTTNTITFSQKFYFDLALIIQLLKDFNDEIISKNSYLIFFNNVILMRRHFGFLKMIAVELEAYPKLVEQLKMKIDEELGKQDPEIKALMNIIKSKHYDKARLLVHNATMRNYLNNWKIAKIENVQKIINKRMNELYMNKNKLLVDDQFEMISFLSVCDYYRQLIADLKQHENSLQEKYTTEFEKINEKISEATIKANSVHMKLTQLKEKYVNYMEFVEKYNEDKASRAEREAKNRTIGAAARAIAKWWKNNQTFLPKKRKKMRKKTNKSMV